MVNILVYISSGEGGGGSQNSSGHGLMERAISISGWAQLGSSNLFRRTGFTASPAVVQLSNRLYVHGEAHRNYCSLCLTRDWSSTEYNNNNSWIQRFNDGNQNNNNKNNNNLVRCVRILTPLFSFYGSRISRSR